MGNLELGKYLAYVLRHKPEDLDISLDKQGWTDLNVLIEKMNLKGWRVTKEDLIKVVEKDKKGRYSIKEDQIRANQGHSLPAVNPVETPTQPPKTLYHGTSPKSWAKIKVEGLNKMERHHVHLTEDYDVAYSVGKRYSKNEKPVILVINSQKMQEAGFVFYLSENKVWLTESVPIAYILGE